MIKLLLNNLFFWFSLIPYFCFSQDNLVKNGDLEDYWNCPTQIDNVIECENFWKYDIFGSPDYANSCALIPSALSLYTIPNQAGSQLPHSGNGFIHSAVLAIAKPRDFTYYDPPWENYQFRESFGGSFVRALEKGTHYIEFYINFTDYGKTGAFSEGRVATNAIDLILLNDSITISNSVSPNINLDDVIKVYKEPYVINDTVNWVKLSTCFQAKGGELFFAIGAFRDTSEILLEFSGQSNFNIYNSSYFFDDFSIYECDTCCLGEFPYEDHVNVVSNPGTSSSPTTFSVLINPNTTGVFSIFDSAGRLTQKYEITELLTTITLENNLVVGIYHYELTTSNGIKDVGKILVNSH
jgi:hypothetical protein